MAVRWALRHAAKRSWEVRRNRRKDGDQRGLLRQKREVGWIHVDVFLYVGKDSVKMMNTLRLQVHSLLFHGYGKLTSNSHIKLIHI